jgi:hypothetical protein
MGEGEGVGGLEDGRRKGGEQSGIEVFFFSKCSFLHFNIKH